MQKMDPDRLSPREAALIEAPQDAPLRPDRLEQFIGQTEVKARLQIAIGAAKKRGEPTSHALFFGPPGLGKTTLAHILAKEMNGALVVTSGPVLEKPSDLAGILTNLQEGDVLFIDEIHRVNRTVEEYLYPAMEDFSIDLVIDSGPHARSVELKLNRFTLVGATTRFGQLSSPMRSRFGLSFRLDYYEKRDLISILRRSAKIMKIEISEPALQEVAARSRGTPRIANHLLRWVRDFASMHSSASISLETTSSALAMLAIDEKGLEEMDKKLLDVIIDHYEGGPVGLSTLSVAVGEEKETIEEVYEPYLILQGFLKRTTRGRVATKLAYEHLGKKAIQSEE